jgi:hypothetical protein
MKGCQENPFTVQKPQGDAVKLLSEVRKPDKIGIFRRKNFPGVEHVSLIIADPK